MGQHALFTSCCRAWRTGDLAIRFSFWGPITVHFFSSEVTGSRGEQGGSSGMFSTIWGRRTKYWMGFKLVDDVCMPLERDSDPLLT